jgi:hypothetical protein
MSVLKKKFKCMRKACLVVDGICSDSYFMPTIGINEGVIKNIYQQGKDDKGGKRILY